MSGVLGFAVAGCATVTPTLDAGIPITITNRDDTHATVEVSRSDAESVHEEVLVAPFAIGPGESHTIIIGLEPEPLTEDLNVRINGILALRGWSGGCGPGDGGPDAAMHVVVWPSGPEVCPDG